MSQNAADYFNQFTALLPFGPAWNVEESSDITALIQGLVQEFSRVQLAADGLVTEADPRTTYQLLPDYQRIFGLSPSATITQSRNALVSQMTSQGGQTVAYLVRLAEAAGFPITISMFSPFTVKSTVNSHLLGASWAYAFQVNAPYAAETAFTVAGGVNEALNSWGNAAAPIPPKAVASQRTSLAKAP